MLSDTVPLPFLQISVDGSYFHFLQVLVPDQALFPFSKLFCIRCHDIFMYWNRQDKVTYNGIPIKTGSCPV